MSEIRGSTQLRAIMLSIAEEVVDKVADNVIKRLKENIMRYVYEYHGSNKEYSPTYEFLESFDWGDVKKNVSGFIREMAYLPERLGSFDPGGWIHGSNYPSEGYDKDARDNLADILNLGGKTGERGGFTSSMFISVPVKPYWNITMRELLDDGLLEKWIDKEIKAVARKYGFVAIKT